MEIQSRGESERRDARFRVSRFLAIYIPPYQTMPQRPPLAVVPVSTAPRRELSYGTKRQLQGRSFAGQTATEIATAEALPHTTVRDVLRRAERNNDVDNATGVAVRQRPPLELVD